MEKITASGIMLALFLISTLSFSFNVQPVNALAHMIYIRADGSVDPPTAPIQRNEDLYTFTGNIIVGSIIVERDNIVIDGAGYTLQAEVPATTGIGLTGRSNVTIKNTEVLGFGWGIKLSDSSHNRICGNNLIRGGERILLYRSSNNTIYENNIESADYVGLHFIDSSNNNISRNTIKDNYGADVYLESSSSNNIIFHNNFLGDFTLQSDNFPNAWDNGYPSGGNYWSNFKNIHPDAKDAYSGPNQDQLGSDGIWDNPFDINANNTDRYPFTGPYGMPVPPSASFAFSPAFNLSVGQPITFNASSSLPGWNGTRPTPIIEYSWNFGDSNTTSTVDPLIIHVYSQVKTYDVTLTVVDSKGLSSSYVQTVEVWMVTFISISTSSSSTGLSVDIKGTLRDIYGKALENELVVLSYTFAGADTWIPLTSDTTDNSGEYSSRWTPSAAGYFTVKAEWTGNATHLGASATISLSTIPYQNEYVFTVESNSTISDLAFNTTTSELHFTVSGQTGTKGYVKVTIAKSLMTNIADAKVYIDGNPTEYSAVSQDDSWILTLTYTHSTHSVAISLKTSTTPNITQWMYLLTAALVLIIVTISGVLIVTRRKHKSKEAASHLLQN